MRLPRAGFLLHVTVVGALFLAPLAATGEGLYWWVPEGASALAWDEAMLQPGTPEYDQWVQAHGADTPHCSSAGSDPNGSGPGSGPCCPTGSEGAWNPYAGGSLGCGSGVAFASEGQAAGSEGDRPGSGGTRARAPAAAAARAAPGAAGPVAGAAAWVAVGAARARPHPVPWPFF